MNELAVNLDAIQSQGLPGSHLPGTVGDLISVILPYIFYGAGIGLLIYLLLGGLQLMLSQGDPKAVQVAQGKITNALIGFVIIILAAAIAGLLGKILGIGVFDSLFGSSLLPVLHIGP